MFSETSILSFLCVYYKIIIVLWGNDTRHNSRETVMGHERPQVTRYVTEM